MSQKVITTWSIQSQVDKTLLLWISSRTAFVQNTACPSRFEPNRHVTHHGTAACVTGTITLSLASQSFPPTPYFTHVVNNARTYASRLRKPCTHLRFASWKRVVQTPYLVSEAMVGWRPIHTHYTTYST